MLVMMNFAYNVLYMFLLYVEMNLQIHPQTMLFGHTGAVTCLAMASNMVDSTFIVSSADNG